MNVPKKLCVVCIMAEKGLCDRRADCEIMTYAETIGFAKKSKFPSAFVDKLSDMILNRTAMGIKNKRLDFTGVIGIAEDMRRCACKQKN